MENTTLSPDEKLIEAARERAGAENTTIDDKFREWPAEYAGTKRLPADAMAVVDELQTKVRTGGRRLTYNEMNER